jgi:hypothetical protein
MKMKQLFKFIKNIFLKTKPKPMYFEYGSCIDEFIDKINTIKNKGSARIVFTYSEKGLEISGEGKHDDLR